MVVDDRVKGKGVSCTKLSFFRRGAHLPYMGLEPVGGYTTEEVCDTWPVRRQTYDHLSGLGACASPPFDRYQFLLFGYRGTQV